MHSQVQFGKLVNIFVDGFSHLWHSDQLTWKKYNSFRVEQKIDQQQVVEQKLTNLIVVEIIQTFKGEVFLLNLFDHFLWQLSELTQWRH